MFLRNTKLIPEDIRKSQINIFRLTLMRRFADRFVRRKTFSTQLLKSDHREKDHIYWFDKGSLPVRKVQFFFNIVQKAFDPPPFVWTSCGEFHVVNFMLLNDLQSTPNLQHSFWTWVWPPPFLNNVKKTAGSVKRYIPKSLWWLWSKITKTVFVEGIPNKMTLRIQ